MHIHEKDEDNQIKKTCTGKEEIENVAIQYNAKHFANTYKSKVWEDKIYLKLQEDEMRNKILAGRLVQEDCNNEDVFEFLKLLKNP